MKNLRELENELTVPSEALIADMARIEGDIMLLGIGGKMGPSMGKLAVDAIKAAGLEKRVYGVSRFSDAGAMKSLQEAGVETISCDLLNDGELQKLPQVQNIVYLAGHKFGTTGNEDFTWAMNAYLPGRVSEKFKNSRLVVFSSGNVLPFVPISSGGATEKTAPEPIGEYAQSCLGRERVFEYFSKTNKTPMLIYRLNYAVDFRYGILLEMAKAVFHEKEIDLSTSNVNVIWQKDANEIALRALLHTTAPARLLNVTGPEILSLHWIASEFGTIFKKEPRFINEPVGTALLNNASECHRLFGYPKTTPREMVEITANWLLQGGDDFGKPTHFQQRGGRF
ncbi:epimerase [Algoriphagus sp. AGSA1]|uniref:NAD-dependent epimerase/dehydratase family protein n=1 Tax=Algoriphagus sp. AGSA1 TaxID=2907213 RepID=UPI001F454AB6|nr:NAD-dependent epimerase/dehydratase family protein [Algoriphagus sp. AGSA1]MCE7057697.1 epimerase [Algoriphagus sp. AGSA1]